MTSMIDPRKGDIEDDASSTKQRSMLSLAGTLLAEISLPKLAAAWTLLIVLPGLTIGAAPLLASIWISSVSGKAAALLTGLWPALLLSILGVLGWFGGRPLLRLADKLHFLLEKSEKPTVTLDVFLPASKIEEFLAWYEREVGFFPLWCVPYRRVHDYEWLADDYWTNEKDGMFLDLAIYGMRQPAGRKKFSAPAAAMSSACQVYSSVTGSLFMGSTALCRLQSTERARWNRHGGGCLRSR